MIKKKLLAALLTGAMLAASTTVVYAAETETEDSSSVIYDETKASYEGTWIPFEAGFQLYLPSDWTVIEVSEEYAAAGIIYQAGNEDGSNVAVTAGQVTDAESLEDIAKQLEGEYDDVELADFNDISVVTYTALEDDILGMAFMDTDGIMYTVNAGPISEEDGFQTAYDIMTSLSLLEGTEAEEAAN